MRKLAWLFLVLVTLFSFMNCTPIATDNSATKLSRLEIVDAKNLFIAPVSSGSKAVAVNELFKITTEGYVQEVTYLGDNGKTINLANAPTAIYNVNETYLIVCFGTNEGYLVRKTDGSVFSLTNVGIPHTQLQFGTFKNALKIQTDINGNIYYQTSTTGEASKVRLIKINVSDPNNLAASYCLPDTDTPLGFFVTQNGNIVYNYGTGSDNRIRKSNGGIYNLPSRGWMPFWIGLDDKIRFQDSTLSNSNITTIAIDTSFNITESVSAGVLINEASVCSDLLRFSDRIIIVNTSFNADIVEVENPSNLPRIVNIPQISRIKHTAQSNDFYFLSGNNDSNNPILLRVNPINDDVSILLSPGLYDIYSMVVDSSNMLTFNALRMSDGAKVIGQVLPTGGINIINETINSDSVILEKIN